MPANTASTIPASDRQLAFINSLRRERGLDPLTIAEQNVLTGGRTGTASAEITRLQDMPLRAMPAASRIEPLDSRPSEANRTGRMINAGGVTATVTLPRGLHVTLVASTRMRSGNGWRNASPFELGATMTLRALGQKVGRVQVDDEGRFAITWAYGATIDAKDAIRALFAYAASEATGEWFGAYRIQVEDRCGRCRRALTDPVSITRGIGPECFGRGTGSHHARVRELGAAGEHTPQEVEAMEALSATVRGAAPAMRATSAAAQSAAAQLGVLAEALTTDVPAEAQPNPGLPRALGSARIAEARELIEKALSALGEDELCEPAERRRAMATFEALVSRVQS